MKHIFFIAAMLLALTSCSVKFKPAKETYHLVERTLKVKPFERIANVSAFEVRYVQGDSCSVRVSGDEKILDKIIITSDGKTLRITCKDSFSSYDCFQDILLGVVDGFEGQKSVPVIYVTSPDLISVSMTGSGSVVANNIVDTDVMTLNLTGSGNIRFADLVCDSAKTVCIGSGDIDIKHLRALNSYVHLKGSGDIKVNQESIPSTTAVVFGSGNVEVCGTDCGKINAELTGSGELTINGKFANVIHKKVGSGDINVNN